MKKLVQFQMLFNNVEVRSEEGVIVIKGMASTPKIDRYRSIITTDAIRNGMGNYLKNPVILLSHNSDKPIGTMSEHKVDNTGLAITARLVRNTDNVFENIRDGITKGFSIGFIPLHRTYKTKDGVPLQSLTSEQLDDLDYNDVVREIDQIDMVEISVCNTPANSDALFSMARAIKDFFETQEKRNFGLMGMITNNTAEDDEEKDETAEDAETTDETTETPAEVEKKEDEDDKDEDDADSEEKPADPVKEEKPKLKDSEFMAVEDDEDDELDDEEDSEDDDTDETDEKADETEEKPSEETKDQENSENIGQEVETAVESPAEVVKTADDESPQSGTEERSFELTEISAIRKVLDEVIETLSVMSEEMTTLKTETFELRSQNADLINRLQNMPMQKGFKTVGGLGALEKKKVEGSTIITTLKQAKREAGVGGDADDDD